MPTVGNGNLATVVYRDRLFLNGLYNGRANQSHRAAIPAINRVKVEDLTEAGFVSLYSLNCITGILKNSSTP